MHLLQLVLYVHATCTCGEETHLCTNTLTHTPLYGFLIAQRVIMSTELYKGHLYSESLDLCMWEAVCCGRGGGSRVNTALSKYTEITAQRRHPVEFQQNTLPALVSHNLAGTTFLH